MHLPQLLPFLEAVFIARDAPAAVTFPPVCVNSPCNAQSVTVKYPLARQKNHSPRLHSLLMNTTSKRGKVKLFILFSAGFLVGYWVAQLPIKNYLTNPIILSIITRIIDEGLHSIGIGVGALLGNKPNGHSDYSF